MTCDDGSDCVDVVDSENMVDDAVLSSEDKLPDQKMLDSVDVVLSRTAPGVEVTSD